MDIFEKVNINNSKSIDYNITNKPAQLIINIPSLENPQLSKVISEVRKYIFECSEIEIIPDIIFYFCIDKKISDIEQINYYQKFISLSYYINQLYKELENNININILYRTYFDLIFLPLIICKSNNILLTGCKFDIKIFKSNLIQTDFDNNLSDLNKCYNIIPEEQLITSSKIFDLVFLKKFNLIK